MAETLLASVAAVRLVPRCHCMLKPSLTPRFQLTADSRPSRARPHGKTRSQRPLDPSKVCSSSRRNTVNASSIHLLDIHLPLQDSDSRIADTEPDTQARAASSFALCHAVALSHNW